MKRDRPFTAAEKKHWRGKIRMFEVVHGNAPKHYEAQFRKWSSQFKCWYWEDVDGSPRFAEINNARTAAKAAWLKEYNKTETHRRKVWP